MRNPLEESLASVSVQFLSPYWLFLIIDNSVSLTLLLFWICHFIVSNSRQIFWLEKVRFLFGKIHEVLV